MVWTGPKRKAQYFNGKLPTLCPKSNLVANIIFSMFRRYFCPSLARSPLFFPKSNNTFSHQDLNPNFSNPVWYYSKSFRSFSATSRFVSSESLMADDRRSKSVDIQPVDKADRSELLRSLGASLGSSFSSEPLLPNPNPLIIVISGPSGVGKDAVIKRLREVREGLHFVVTATSRKMREGEVDGRDYYFVSKDEFLTMVEKNELLEYALVYGDYKGIPKKQIREFVAKGYDIVLRVDIQGAETLRKKLGNSAVFLFLVAESELALVERLIGRKTETKESLLVRVSTAREEVKHVKNFDYAIVNVEGKLDNTVKLVESIIDAEKAKVRQRNAVI